MEPVIALLVGLFIAVAAYLMLSRALVRVLLGIVVLGNAVNLLILPAGEKMPVGYFANPLPQALILTAIVIGFAMFAFLIVLAFRAYQEMHADDTDQMRLAEPDGEPRPPLEY